jgi:hypothetical protein
MNRCRLRGQTDDAIHAVLCAAGYNIRWLLRMIRKKGIGLFFVAPPGTGLVEMSRNYSLIGNHQTAFNLPNSNRTSIRLIKTDFSGTTG